MSLYGLKIKVYRFFNTKIGISVLKSLSCFVRVKNIKPKNNGNLGKKFPFIVSITIDTESGYVDYNDHRIWQKSSPKSYIGYYKGIENWRKLLNKYGAKGTFFLSTNCFSAEGSEYKKILGQLRLLMKEGHEIGLHLHPDSDLALQKHLNKKFIATSANFYSKDEMGRIIKGSLELIGKNLGKAASKNVKSVRWGNWALNTDGAKALEEHGFSIDSSATPGIKGHSGDSMQFDWSKSNSHYPWKLSTKNYQNTKDNNSEILEMPIATFNFLGLTLRADSANSYLLNAAFDYY